MSAVQILDQIFWVGAVDWNIRYFHGPAYSIHRGTTYNSYLIVDEKVALVDTVYGPFTSELVDNIKEIIPLEKIDYVVVNHIESDHSGAFPEIMKLVPKAKVLCTQKAMEGLKKHFHGDWDFQVVKTKDSVSLGRRSLTFIEAPMLHWPDSMFTYVKEEALLLPNDAFGQHIATSHRFDDEVNINHVMDEAAKYYANILWPFSRLVARKIDEIVAMGLEIKMIAPSHGIIWRGDPMRIVNAYAGWAKGETRKKAVIVYDTMWESTEKMAKAILQGLVSQGIETKLFKMSVSDRNDIISEMLDAKAVVVGSPTINNDMLPVMAPLLDDLIGLKPLNKMGMAFGSYGWKGGAVDTIKKRLHEAGIQLVEQVPVVKWVPTEAELQECYRAGQALAGQI
ncbi:MAG: FprA family A-type flavoprotein [Bacillota bacterium]